jgi:uncharacterized repeat protein (TIGR01451 family)
MYAGHEKGNYQMKKLMQYRRFIINMIGILPLLISLGSSNVVLAATMSTADVSVTLVADQSKLKAGQTITYTATMTNLGPDDAGFVDVRFSLPPQLILIDMTCSYGISADTPFCEYTRLLPGETVVSTVVATLNPDVPAPERNLTVTADILLEQDCSFEPDVCTFDPNLSNNLASVSTRLIGKLPRP